MILNVIIIYLLVNYVWAITKYPLLIIVSYDAFRYNYFEKGATPYLSKLRQEGTTADYLMNVFPTKTFPNHHSIATGLYPETHGVVGNHFYDPKSQKIVQISYEMFHYNEDITPIWILNEKAAADRYSGVMMWPGGNYEYNNINATYIYPWDKNVSWFDRVDTVMSWITDKSKPANLIMLYFEEPDTHGHVYGPDSFQVYNLLKTLNNITEYLHGKLKQHGLSDKANVIHISDHGMSSVQYKNIIDLTKYLKPDTYDIADTSPCLHFIPKKGFEDETYAGLRNVSLSNKNFKLYKKSEILERWHFKNNPRIPPILAVAEPGYAFQDMFDAAKYYAKEFGILVTPETKFGCHGYDNEDRDMHPFFIAKGPRIKGNHKVPPFSTLDLFNLFCTVLDINMIANNGTFANVRDILQSSTSTVVSPVLIAAVAKPGYAFQDMFDAAKYYAMEFGVQVGGCILSVSFIGCVVAVIILLKRNKSRTEYPSTFGTIINEQEEDWVEAQHLLEQEDI